MTREQKIELIYLIKKWREEQGRNSEFKRIHGEAITEELEIEIKEMEGLK